MRLQTRHISARPRKIVVLTLLLQLALVGSYQVHAEDWYRVESPDGRASVLFPNPADEKETVVDRTPGGKVVTKVAQHQGEGILMSISNTALPGLAAAFAGRKMIFRNSKSGVLKASYGREISSKKMDIPGADAALMMRYEAVDFEDPDHPGFNGMALFVILDQNIYTLNSMISRESPDNEAMQEKLLRSFAINEQSD